MIKYNNKYLHRKSSRWKKVYFEVIKFLITSISNGDNLKKMLSGARSAHTAERIKTEPIYVKYNIAPDTFYFDISDYTIINEYIEEAKYFLDILATRRKELNGDERVYPVIYLYEDELDILREIIFAHHESCRCSACRKGKGLPCSDGCKCIKCQKKDHKPNDSQCNCDYCLMKKRSVKTIKVDMSYDIHNYLTNLAKENGVSITKLIEFFISYGMLNYQENRDCINILNKKGGQNAKN